MTMQYVQKTRILSGFNSIDYILNMIYNFLIGSCFFIKQTGNYQLRKIAY